MITLPSTRTTVDQQHGYRSHGSTDRGQAKAGNLSFDVYRNIDEPRRYVVLERFSSSAAYAEHRATTHFKDIVLGQILPRLETQAVEQYEVTPQ